MSRRLLVPFAVLALAAGAAFLAEGPHPPQEPPGRDEAPAAGGERTLPPPADVAPAPRRAAGGEAALRGRVLADGQPIAGVVLEIAPGDQKTTSAGDGSWSFPGAAPGAYRLAWRAERHADGAIDVHVPAGGTVRDVHLVPGSRLRVEVTRRDLERGHVAAAGATVTAVRPEDGTTAETATGDGGRGELPHLAAGGWRVTASLDRHIPHLRIVELPCAEPVAFELVPEAISTIRVRAVDGAPVPGAQLLLSDPPHRLAPRAARLVGRADENGELRFAFDHDARAGLWVIASGFRATYVSPVNPEVAETIEVRLRRGGRISGTVSDEEGRGIAGATVHIESYDDDSNARVEVTLTAAADGGFSFEGVAPNDLALVATASGYRPAEARIERLEANAPPVELILARGSVVTGTVVGASGAAVPGVLVAIPDTRGSDVTDRHGRFEIGGLSSRLTSTGTEVDFTLGDLVWTVPITPGGPATIPVPDPTRIAGRVIASPGDGGPVTAFTVEIRLGAGRRVALRRRFESAPGTFAFDLADTPATEIVVLAAGYAPWRSELDAIAPGDRATLLVPLARHGSLALEVVDAAGALVDQAYVEVLDDTALRRDRTFTTNGVARFGTLDRRVRPVVVRTGFAPHRGDWIEPAPGTELRRTIRLSPAAVARVIVTGDDGPIVTGATRLLVESRRPNAATVTVASLDLRLEIEGRGAELLRHRRPHVDGGAIVIDGLPEGGYALIAIRGARRSEKVALSIHGGGDETVQAQLR